MNVDLATLVYFSPTRTTKRVLEGIVRGIKVSAVEHLDLTSPGASAGAPVDMHDELAIIGAPVYGGRIPPDAVRRLRRLKGHDTPAVIVVVYGNRAYEDALRELQDLVAAAGFRPVAGGAFVGEHSFSIAAMPIAAGRPDQADLDQARALGRRVQEKLEGVRNLDEMGPLHVPGDVPYKERGKPSPIAPVTREAQCTLCEKCAIACPTAAITVGDVVTTDPEACILCCACVKICPDDARVMADPRIERTTEWLYTNFGARKEPEVYV